MHTPLVLGGRIFPGGGLSPLDDGRVALEAGRIAFVGPPAALPERFRTLPLQRAGVITPGLIDAHTHAAWMGSRHDEYVAKLRGEGYEAIAARGGGIVASMRAIEQADVDTIAEVLAARLRRMAALGVTTVEVKSGYGLRPDLERRQLAAIAAVSAHHDLPRVVPTFLALHALPPEARGDAALRRRYVEGAVALVPEIAARGHARFVDAWVDRNAFTIEEVRMLGRAARDAGLGVRLHVGQFADVGGAELAAELGARSADHLEVVSPPGIEALARAGVSVTLLPVASFVLQQRPPDIPALRASGVPLVVASDANPGTSPTESLPLAMSLAARLYGLSTAEIVDGTTARAAHALELTDTGVLREGARADVVAWDLPHENALLQPWGAPRTCLVIRDGRILHRGSQQDPTAADRG